MPSLKNFAFETDDELRALEAQLDRYVEARSGFSSTTFFSLVEVRKNLRENPHGGRIFVSLLDIKLNLGLLHCDLISLGKQFNRALRHVDDRSPLAGDDEIFDLRMDVHLAANSFIFRFRSLWDKVMGLYVLLLSPAQYDQFCNAKKKKREFGKIMKGFPLMSEFVTKSEKVIQQLDDTFRTPEAHGSGVLRKSTFTWEHPQECPAMTLINYWNFACEVYHLIGTTLDPTRSAIKGAEITQANVGSIEAQER